MCARKQVKCGGLEDGLLHLLDATIHCLDPLRNADRRVLVADEVADLSADQVGRVRREVSFFGKVEVRDGIQ